MVKFISSIKSDCEAEIKLFFLILGHITIQGPANSKGPAYKLFIVFELKIKRL